MTQAPIRIALVGLGKIARDQHLPALAADPRFDLVAVADPAASLPNVPSFASLEALLGSGIALDAVSLCTPPHGRERIAIAAIAAGLHVMAEKPPAATLSAAEAMAAAAQAKGTTLFAAWHSREAGAVAPARAWLADKRIDRFEIIWAEDIRRWHPGQDWILAAGGFGVFDPGINALSIATAILPAPILVERATMTVPADRAAPLTADLALSSGAAAGTAAFDFERSGEQRWDIAVETEAGTLGIGSGGAALTLDGATRSFPDAEYPRLYARFADLIAERASEVDLAPLRLVADAFLLAERRTGPPFAW